MENVLKQEDSVAKEVAVKELQEFVAKWTYEEVDSWKIEDDYPQALKAVQKGLLTFDSEKKAHYNLAFPIKNTEGEISEPSVDFRTRIKPLDLANITEGLNVSKKQVEYTLRCLAYITGKSKELLNKFEKFDYKVVEQVSTVFF